MASTFKAKPVIDPLEREQREIERRRQRFMDRTARILHAKTRIIGVDAEGLKRQQEEKQQREQAEKERESQFAEMMNRHAQMVTDQVVQMERDKRRQNQEVANYRKEQEMDKRAKDVATRSFDLANNPEAETVMMKFPGEDLGKKDRVKMQQSQQQDWLAQQLGILAEKEERERQEEAEYAAMQAQIVAMKKQMEQERDHFRTKRNVETKEANQNMSADRRSRTLQDAAINEARNQEMLKAQLTGDFLNEAVPQSAFGAHRIVPYAFKGMTVDQKQKILDEQGRQLAEAKAARDKAEQEERQYAQQQEEIRRALVKAQREKAAQERQARLNLLQDQQVQKREKDERTQHLDRAVYQNPVDPSYFDQWGKSCR